MKLLKRALKIRKQSNNENQFEKQIQKASQYDLIKL